MSEGLVPDQTIGRKPPSALLALVSYEISAMETSLDLVSRTGLEPLGTVVMLEDDPRERNGPRQK